MDPLSSEHRFWLCIATFALAAIFCGANIYRSVTLKKGFSEITIKMYVAFFVVAIIAVLGLSGVVQSNALLGVLGVVVGYVLGEKAISAIKLSIPEPAAIMKQTPVIGWSETILDQP